jgi:hypothetical protein
MRYMQWHSNLVFRYCANVDHACILDLLLLLAWFIKPISPYIQKDYICIYLKFSGEKMKIKIWAQKDNSQLEIKNSKDSGTIL